MEIEHPSCGPIKLVNTPVKFSDAKPGIRTSPPMLGQHSDEVLRDLVGLGEDKIAQLKEQKIVA